MDLGDPDAGKFLAMTLADFELCRLNQDVWPGLRGWQTAEGKDRNLAGRLLLFELSCNPWQSCYGMSGQRS